MPLIFTIFFMGIGLIFGFDHEVFTAEVAQGIELTSYGSYLIGMTFAMIFQAIVQQ